MSSKGRVSEQAVHEEHGRFCRIAFQPKGEPLVTVYPWRRRALREDFAQAPQRTVWSWATEYGRGISFVSYSGTEDLIARARQLTKTLQHDGEAFKGLLAVRPNK